MLRELWAARHLLVILARKDFYVNYRRTVLGVVWAVGVPLVQAVVLALVFTHVVGIGRNYAASQSQYAVFLYAALVPWNYIANAGPAASTAIVDNVALAGKIYFPRALPVLVTAASAMYPLAVGIVLLLVMSLLVGGGVDASFLLVIPGAALVGAVRRLCRVVSVRRARLLPRHPLHRDGGAVGRLLSDADHLSAREPSGVAPRAARPACARAGCRTDRDLPGRDGGSRPGARRSPSQPALDWCVVFGGVGFWLQCRRDRVFVDLL